MSKKYYRLKHDNSKEDIKWLIKYTGWSKENAKNALKSWKKYKNE